MNFSESLEALKHGKKILCSVSWSWSNSLSGPKVTSRSRSRSIL
jgi:hypothetical protein